MNPHRPVSFLAIAAVVTLTVATLGWLLFGYAGNPAGRIQLPDGRWATVDYLYAPDAGVAPDSPSRLPADGWTRWSDEKYLADKRGHILWLRATLRNPGDQPLSGVLENNDYFTDEADAWIAENDGSWSWLRSGEMLSAEEKILPGREIAWPVVLPAGGSRTVYVRLSDFFGEYALLVWWPEAKNFHLARLHSGLAEGVYFGGLLALLGYTALLWVRLRAADLGRYVLYLVAAAAFMLLARAQLPALGWPLGSPGLETALTIAMALANGFLICFARVFLETEAKLPRVDFWMRGLCLGLWALASVTLVTMWLPLGRWLWLAILFSGVTHLGLFVVASLAWRAGVWQARFFVLSFGCLFAGSLPMVAVWFWEGQMRDAAMRGLMIGSALEVLLLSLALADRFVRTQRRLTEETEQRRMIEAAYADELAEEVRERTRELQDANADKDRMLAVIGHDLRSPLTGLMRSADQATGDFARETARTGRALLLMIEDLVRWARLRAGTRMVATHQATGLVAPAVALHHSLAEHGGVALTLEVPEGLRVETDLVLAQTLVRNLLANALKFARTQVVLRAADDGAGGVRITVGNDGPPLPPAVAARLATGEDEPMTATGGMGLRLCREICQALGMRLEAVSGPEGGTEFGFTLRKAATEEKKS